MPPIRWEVALHPAPRGPFARPSSHSSPHSTTPLPHPSSLQEGEQPSHAVLLPSSHCSSPSTLPLPHTEGCTPQGLRFGFRTGVAGGVTVPVMIGGFPGSRYSSMLTLETSVPPIV